MKDFSEALKKVPEEPGIYLMFDAEDTLIYVGKAVNLKRRVSSYFTPSRQGKSVKVRSMVEHIDHFEYIIVDNEVESLVLESNFIKEHAPKYNIVLRDDKQYPYIAISKETYPRLLKLRQVEEDGSEYFGPFPNAYAVNDMIRFLQRTYKIRTCRLDIDKGARLKRPCLNYYIGQCPGPCADLADPQAYQENVDKVREILKGHEKPVRDYLQAEMKKAAEALDFEKAASFRDALGELDQIMARQQVSFTNGQDADLIAMARADKAITIQVYFIRGGKLVDREHFRMENAGVDEDAEVMSQFFKQFYLHALYIPKEIYAETEPADKGVIEQYLSQRKGQKVEIKMPQRGRKSALMETAHRNAEEQLAKEEIREERKNRSRGRGVRELEELTGLSGLERIEAYDISNISGVQNVGSMVVFRRERREPKEYRKFKIQTVEGINEYASQQEMLERRFDHGLSDRAAGKTETGFGCFPDLILMDGGKGQVHVCQAVLAARGLDIPVMGMVKDDKHKTRALLYRDREYLVDPRSALYRYLYSVQEEVHRFAISYHRQLRDQTMVKSELDEIPGIGAKRKKELLRAFGTIEAIGQASLEALRAVEGMNARAAENVFAHFHGGSVAGTGPAAMARTDRHDPTGPDGAREEEQGKR